MNKITFIASFTTGGFLDVVGVFNPLNKILNIAVSLNPAIAITHFDIINLGLNLLGLLISGFLAAFGAYMFTLIRRKYFDKKNGTN